MTNCSHAQSVRICCRRTVSFVLIASAVLFCACVEPLEMDAIAENTIDLCNDHAAFDEALDQCGADCAGVASVSGSLLSMEMQMDDASLHGASVKVVRFFDGDEQVGEVIDAIDFDLHGTYGDFLFEFKDLDALPASGEGLQMAPGPRGEGLARTGDGLLRTSIRISNGTESDNVAAVQGGGFLRIEEMSTSRVKGSFDIRYGNESNRLIGCFEIVPVEVTHEREDIQSN